MPRDVEKDTMTVQYISGFADLARVISSDIDGNAAIFRRFDNLAARNLLYLQSELAELEAQQLELDRQDASDRATAGLWDTFSTTSKDWGAFERAAKAPKHPAARLQKRMDLITTTRQKLKEYREALLMESAIFSMRRPSRQDHDAFHRKFWNEGNGKRRGPALGGHSESLYEDREDLLAFKRAAHEDRLTKFLRRSFPGMFKIAPGRSRNSGIEYFSAARISRVANLITIILAAALLFGAIYNLYYVRRDHVKLALIAVYTLAFALSTGWITNAGRAEIFGACAAYAAVLVVFVSGDLGSNTRAT